MKAGLPLPVPQRPVFDGAGRIVRVDFLYLDLRIVIEADGFTWHDDPFAVARDNDRRNRMALEGWLVLTFTWQHVKFQPDEVVAQVRKALETRE
jgi:very-short-patch-repair endonuclease